jgi:hypothetical protein
MNFSATLETLSTTSPTPTLAVTSTAGFLSTTTTEIPPEDCPVYDKSDDDIIEMFSFW